MVLSDINIGQYFSKDSIVHALDPRTKIIGIILFITSIFVADSLFSVLFVVVLTATIISITKIPIRLYFSTIKRIWIFIVITAILNMLYIPGTVIFEFGIISITQEGILRAILTSTRVILLIIISSCLTFTTSPTDLTYGIEKLLMPLSYIRLGNAVHALAMMMTIALRFIPTIMEETDKISSAQKARGADLESGNLINRVKALIPILIPLLISSFRRAAELADAMESRCYIGGDGRTRMKQLHFKVKDIITLILFAIFLVAVFCLNGYNII